MNRAAESRRRSTRLVAVLLLATLLMLVAGGGPAAGARKTKFVRSEVLLFLRWKPDENGFCRGYSKMLSIESGPNCDFDVFRALRGEGSNTNSWTSAWTDLDRSLGKFRLDATRDLRAHFVIKGFAIAETLEVTFASQDVAPGPISNGGLADLGSASSDEYSLVNDSVEIDLKIRPPRKLNKRVLGGIYMFPEFNNPVRSRSLTHFDLHAPSYIVIPVWEER